MREFKKPRLMPISEDSSSDEDEPLSSQEIRADPVLSKYTDELLKSFSDGFEIIRLKKLITRYEKQDPVFDIFERNTEQNKNILHFLSLSSEENKSIEFFDEIIKVLKRPGPLMLVRKKSDYDFSPLMYALLKNRVKYFSRLLGVMLNSNSVLHKNISETDSSELINFTVENISRMASAPGEEWVVPLRNVDSIKKIYKPIVDYAFQKNSLWDRSNYESLAKLFLLEIAENPKQVNPLNYLLQKGKDNNLQALEWCFCKISKEYLNKYLTKPFIKKFSPLHSICNFHGSVAIFEKAIKSIPSGMKSEDFTGHESNILHGIFDNYCAIQSDYTRILMFKSEIRPSVIRELVIQSNVNKRYPLEKSLDRILMLIDRLHRARNVLTSYNAEKKKIQSQVKAFQYFCEEFSFVFIIDIIPIDMLIKINNKLIDDKEIELSNYFIFSLFPTAIKSSNEDDKERLLNNLRLLGWGDAHIESLISSEKPVDREEHQAIIVQLKKSAAELTALKKSARANKAKADSVQKRLSWNAGEVAKIKKITSQKDEAIKILKSQLEEERNKLKRTTLELKANKRKINPLEEQNKKLKGIVGDKEALLKSAEDKYVSSETSLEKTRARNAEEISKIKTEKDGEIKRLEKKLKKEGDKLDGLNLALQSNTRKLKMEIAKNKRLKKEATVNHKKNQESLRSLQAKLKSSHAALEKKEFSKALLEKKLASHDEQLSTVTQALEKVKETNAALIARSSILKKRDEHLESECKTLETMLQSKIRELDVSKRDGEKLKSLLGKIKTAHKAELAALKQAQKNRIAAKDEEINQIKDSSSALNKSSSGFFTRSDEDRDEPGVRANKKKESMDPAEVGSPSQPKYRSFSKKILGKDIDAKDLITKETKRIEDQKKANRTGRKGEENSFEYLKKKYIAKYNAEIEIDRADIVQLSVKDNSVKPYKYIKIFWYNRAAPAGSYDTQDHDIKIEKLLSASEIPGKETFIEVKAAAQKNSKNYMTFTKNEVKLMYELHNQAILEKKNSRYKVHRWYLSENSKRPEVIKNPFKTMVMSGKFLSTIAVTDDTDLFEKSSSAKKLF